MIKKFISKSYFISGILGGFVASIILFLFFIQSLILSFSFENDASISIGIVTEYNKHDMSSELTIKESNRPSVTFSLKSEIDTSNLIGQNVHVKYLTTERTISVYKSNDAILYSNVKKIRNEIRFDSLESFLGSLVFLWILLKSIKLSKNV